MKRKKISLAAPEKRGCLDCNRWHAFVKHIWEAERELCPEENCVKLASCIKLISVDKTKQLLET